MRRRRPVALATLALLAVVALGVAACGGDDETEPVDIEQPSEEPAAEEVVAPDLEPIDSGIEDVPIPATAEAHPDSEDTWTVDGVSYDELVAWYEAQMPDEQDFGPWTWCDTGGGDAGSGSIHAHIYSRGAREILGVSVTADDPPGIVIGADESGPC